ncbi:MAG: beta-L-arabinofuranosidase domain-containing protein [Kiritimatiellales bacterium]
MNHPKTIITIVSLLLAAQAAHATNDLPAADYIVDHRHSPHAQLRPVPFDAVQWTDGFWADRFKQVCDVTLDESWRLLADPDAGHVLDNFRFAAKPGSGKYVGTMWQDEWLYKWIEAAACVWRVTRDPEVERRMNEGIALIAAAQQPDGYLSTMPLVTGKPRFQDAKDHEVYNMGHLLTAGVIHYRMTGKDDLLNIAKRAGDFLCANLGVTVKPYLAHNPSAIMGLVELYRLTGEQKYLQCAQLIVDRRGENPKKRSRDEYQTGMEGTDVIQDRVPVRKSSEIVGHNVFFTYLYTGAADLVAESGEDELQSALDRLWTDMTERKMFIHGGVSAIPSGVSASKDFVNEAAGAPYQLPNGSCYNETCGQIGAFMWGYRMLVDHPDGQFADIMEREMFNGFIPCIGLEGKSWFYRTVIRRYDENYKPKGGTDMATRQLPGRKQICCPSNLLRTMAELSAYFYSLDEAGLWVHHYGGNKLNCQLLSGEAFALEQVTDYPWSGEVKFVIRQAPAKSVLLRLRVPGWADKAAFAINGKPVTDAKSEHGYVTFAQTWRTGDTITLSLPMESTLVAADPRVEETRNQVAVMRGPVLYCVESPDLPPGVDVPSVLVPSTSTFKPVVGLAGVESPLAGKTVLLRGPALHRAEPRTPPLYRPLSLESSQPFDLTLIPYYAWANRGRSAMSVWLPVVLKN